MSYISVTNSFGPLTTISSTDVNTNFQDIVSGTSDGSKDLNMYNAAFAGTSFSFGGGGLAGINMFNIYNAAFSGTVFKVQVDNGAGYILDAETLSSDAASGGIKITAGGSSTQKALYAIDLVGAAASYAGYFTGKVVVDGHDNSGDSLTADTNSGAHYAIKATASAAGSSGCLNAVSNGGAATAIAIRAQDANALAGTTAITALGKVVIGNNDDTGDSLVVTTDAGAHYAINCQATASGSLGGLSASTGGANASTAILATDSVALAGSSAIKTNGKIIMESIVGPTTVPVAGNCSLWWDGSNMYVMRGSDGKTSKLTGTWA
jgi:hypothetical protein